MHFMTCSSRCVCFGAAGSKQQYMAKLLQIVEQKLHAGEVDVTLKFTLSALWNLTDESPSTCETFLEVSSVFRGSYAVNPALFKKLEQFLEVEKFCYDVREYLQLQSMSYSVLTP